MTVILLRSLNLIVYMILKSPVLWPFQLITADGCDSLCSVSFPHQLLGFRGQPGSLRVCNSPFLNRNWKAKLVYL